jgi:hypothetical protein
MARRIGYNLLFRCYWFESGISGHFAYLHLRGLSILFGFEESAEFLHVSFLLLAIFFESEQSFLYIGEYFFEGIAIIDGLLNLFLRLWGLYLWFV